MGLTKKSPKFREPKAKSEVIALRDAHEVEVIERKYQIVELRRQGYTVIQIARELNISPPTVSRDLKDVLNNTVRLYQESTEESRQLQIERLDKLLKVYIPYAEEPHTEIRQDMNGNDVFVQVPPNPVYAALVLKIEERRAKLMALDKPENKNDEVSAIREYVGIDMDEV